MVNPEMKRGLVAMLLGVATALVGLPAPVIAQEQVSPDELLRRSIRAGRDAASAAENEYYELITLPLPDDVVLEVGGLIQLSDGRIMAATRRGDVYIVENAYSNPPNPTFKRFASGLAQPLGLLELDGWIYFAQRGELSRMRDTDGDDLVDIIETVTDDWALSGNYHEYAFGPRQTADGKLWVTLNKPFGEEPYGQADWRGWGVRVDPETGTMEPVVGGLRSPAGVEVSPWGDVFYTDNQGEWCNASKLSVLQVGDFHGHPHGMGSAVYPESQVEPLSEDQVLEGVMMKDLDQVVPHFRMPAVWFPYVKLGQSPSGFKWDTTGGGFGPFDGQIFVGDQHHAMIMRVFLEQVNGHWQGAAFVFRQGLQSGVIRVAFGGDDSLFVGMSARGWSGIGPDPYGLERIVWTGRTPFEVHEMRAQTDGFEIAFTRPVDAATAADPASYRMESYTYRLSEQYGGPEEDKLDVRIVAADVAEDGLSVRLTIDPIRAGYVHELHLTGVRDPDGNALLHDQAYYTLVEIPEGN
jgi:glucose/arabinose dehydrogenase